MKIETKFDIGQKVWVIWGWQILPEKCRVAEETIDWLKVYRTNPKAQKFSVAYRIKQNGFGKAYMFCEKDVYATKAEAQTKLNELLNKKGEQCK